MPPVISVHEYELVPGATGEDIERAFREAADRGLFDLPGLESGRLVEGIRGDRKDRWAALWVYESREAWARLWGPAGDPVPKEAYPDRWRTWEDELLGPLIVDDPDRVRFTSYRTVAGTEPGG